MRSKTLSLIIIVILIPIALFSNPPTREFWRLLNHNSSSYSSGPGGPSGTSKNLHYIYNNLQPMFINSVNLHSVFWSDYGNEQTDSVVEYTSTLTNLSDRYILTYIPTPGFGLKSETIVRDYNDRFLSYATYYDPEFPIYRYDWTYNSNGRLAEIFSYRNPQYYIGTGYWKYVPDYDSLDRKIIEIRYHSDDSISWSPSYKLMYHYSTNTLPESFLVKEREPYWNFEYFKFMDVVDNYQIDSLAIFNYVDNQWSRIGRLSYSYNVNYDNGSIFIGVQENSIVDYFLTMVYPATYLEGVTYYLNGFIRYYFMYSDMYNQYYSNDDSYTWIDEYTSFEEMSPSQPVLFLSAYPNPFNTNLNIKLDSKTPINSDISIYNIKGQLIRSWKGIKSNELTWDGRDKDNKPVKSGVYIIRVKNRSQIYASRLIKL